MLTELMQQITSRKLAWRRQLAALPVGEKLRMLEEMVKAAERISATRPPKPAVAVRQAGGQAFPGRGLVLLCFAGMMSLLAGCDGREGVRQAPSAISATVVSLNVDTVGDAARTIAAADTGTPVADTSPAPASAEPAAADQSSRLWAMRKKIAQRGQQRAGTYLEQMNEALQSGDTEGAESALKAAIAQGKLTQSQINDARDQISSEISKQQQAMVAAARAKAEAEASEAAAEESRMAANADPNESVPSDSVPAGSQSIYLKFTGYGLNSIRVFNVTGAGSESDRQTDVSPGNCSEAKASEANDDWTSYHRVFVDDDGKGVA